MTNTYKLPNGTSKDVHAGSNEYINTALINRGRTRLLENDKALLELFNSSFGGNVFTDTRLLKSVDPETGEEIYTAVSINKLLKESVINDGDILAADVSKDPLGNITGVSFRIHTPSYSVDSLSNVNTADIPSEGTVSLVYDRTSKTWKPGAVIGGNETTFVKRIDHTFYIEQNTKIKLPVPLNEGDKLSIVRPSEHFVHITCSTDEVKGFTATIDGTTHTEIFAHSDDDDEHTSLELIAVKETENKFKWVIACATGDWGIEVRMAPDEETQIPNYPAPETFTEILPSSVNLSRHGVMADLADTPDSVELDEDDNFLVTEIIDGKVKYVHKPRKHSIVDPDYHSDVDNRGYTSGDVMMFDGTKFVPQQFNSTELLEAPAGTLLEVFMESEDSDISNILAMGWQEANGDNDTPVIPRYELLDDDGNPRTGKYSWIATIVKHTSALTAIQQINSTVYISGSAAVTEPSLQFTIFADDKPISDVSDNTVGDVYPINLSAVNFGGIIEGIAEGSIADPIESWSDILAFESGLPTTPVTIDSIDYDVVDPAASSKFLLRSGFTNTEIEGSFDFSGLSDVVGTSSISDIAEVKLSINWQNKSIVGNYSKNAGGGIFKKSQGYFAGTFNEIDFIASTRYANDTLYLIDGQIYRIKNVLIEAESTFGINQVDAQPGITISAFVHEGDTPKIYEDSMWISGLPKPGHTDLVTYKISDIDYTNTFNN